MAFDRSKLGNLAAEQMQALEEKYGEEEENVEIGAVLEPARHAGQHDVEAGDG